MRLGFAPVFAGDNDAAALVIAEENARRNGLRPLLFGADVTVAALELPSGRHRRRQHRAGAHHRARRALRERRAPPGRRTRAPSCWRVYSTSRWRRRWPPLPVTEGARRARGRVGLRRARGRAVSAAQGAGATRTAAARRRRDRRTAARTRRLRRLQGEPGRQRGRAGQPGAPGLPAGRRSRPGRRTGRAHLRRDRRGRTLVAPACAPSGGPRPAGGRRRLRGGAAPRAVRRARSAGWPFRTRHRRRPRGGGRLRARGGRAAPARCPGQRPTPPPAGRPRQPHPFHAEGTGRLRRELLVLRRASGAWPALGLAAGEAVEQAQRPSRPAAARSCFPASTSAPTATRPAATTWPA